MAADHPWSLLISPPASGARNMALDHALLDLAAGRGVTVLRLYRWNPPCLSLGRNEPARRYAPARIAALGIDVVRRPTGGRAVWHEHELTYAIAMPAAGLGSIADTVAMIHAIFADALRTLGLTATPAPRRPAARPDAGACFAAPMGGELLIGGKKVLGSAQLRERGALLQHGALLLDGD
ncbi:MAG: lipoate--protein ligase family protein, partial [Gemmatimonadota bacterium]